MSFETGSDHVTVPATARMLRMLRSVPMGALKVYIEETSGELMRLNAGQLADHLLIQQLMANGTLAVGGVSVSDAPTKTAESHATSSAAPEGR